MPVIASRKTNDPEKTRQRIIEAAIHHFSERGFAGASIADIAETAEVQKSLVLYHFGGKEELWSAACSEAAAPVLAMATRLMSEKPLPPLPEILRRRFRVLQENPALQRLIVWMGLGGAPMPRGPAEAVPRLVETFSAAFPKNSEGARRTLLLCLSAMDGYFMHRNTLRRLMDQGSDANRQDDEFLHYLLQIAQDEVTLLHETQS